MFVCNVSKQYGQLTVPLAFYFSWWDNMSDGKRVMLMTRNNLGTFQNRRFGNDVNVM